MNKRVICFDIDGTLANIEHRRHHVMNDKKNWAAFNDAMIDDTPNHDIVWMRQTFQSQKEVAVILCSGRGEEKRATTELWMNQFNITYDKLYMRPAKDYRPDNEIKVELLGDIIRDFGVPFLWVDDRDQVVNAIRAQGIRVLQVAPGDF